MRPAWQEILANVCSYFLDSMPRGIKAILDAKVDTEDIAGE